MEKIKMDYNHMKLEVMTEWVMANEELLAREKQELFFQFLDDSLGENGKRNTNKAKKTFYKLAKDYVEFDNPPTGKKKKKEDKTVNSLLELRKKYNR